MPNEFCSKCGRVVQALVGAAPQPAAEVRCVYCGPVGGYTAAPAPRYAPAYALLQRHESGCNACWAGRPCKRGQELLQAANDAVREDRRHGKAG
jgi:hypothetical protein